MEEIIKVEERNNTQVVNARELHQFLMVGKDFSTWIKSRIEKYGFVENEDFEVFPNFGENPNGGRPTKEYAITLDMAKELAMVENNEQGRIARKYFIECEKRLKEAKKPKSATELFYQSVLALKEQEERMNKLENRLDAWDKEREENGKLLLSVSLSTNKVPEVKLRDKVRQLVNRYSAATNTRQCEVWHKIYEILYYSYGISINSYKRKTKQNKLDIAEENGFLGKMYDVISNMAKSI